MHQITFYFKIFNKPNIDEEKFSSAYPYGTTVTMDGMTHAIDSFSLNASTLSAAMSAANERVRGLESMSAEIATDVSEDIYNSSEADWGNMNMRLSTISEMLQNAFDEDIEE